MKVMADRRPAIIRGVVIVSVLAYALWMFCRNLFWDVVADDVKLVLRAEGMGASLPEYEYAYLIWMALSGISYLGIWFFKKWGVRLLIAIYLVSFMIFPFSGIMIALPLERVALTIFLLSDGVIIALAGCAWNDLLA